MGDKIPLGDVRRKFNATPDVWTKEDYWHFHLHQSYRRILKYTKSIFAGSTVLNVGSSSENYGIQCAAMIYLDVAEKSLPIGELAICGDVQNIPLKNNCFDSAIAIGSVLNYCAPAEFFSEISRVLRNDDYFLFDFEQSEAFEHYGNDIFGKKAHIFQTDFNGYDETIWVFKLEYIKNLLTYSEFNIIKIKHIHSISSLVWRLTRNNKMATAACKVDFLSCSLPFFRRLSSSVFVIAQKKSSKGA
ncbi:methyltransferase domain-containing protein [Methylorubrum sp. SB2]|uniref:methyltransferase domain-containing protein n=1 Tax=Methylorubrum subtropicum TaxID=3138812 RepID=UPI00313CC8B9